MDFVHFNIHTDYSLLHSSLKLQELVKKAKEYNFKALAITELGNMFSAVDFYKQAKDFKPIIGIDAYVENENFRLKLIAKTKKGYDNLMYLSSISYLYNYKNNQFPIIPYEELVKHKDGIVVIIGYESEVVFHLNLFNQDNFLKGALGYQKAKEITQKYKNDFKDIYFEIRRDFSEQKFFENEIISLSKEFDIPLLATTDVWHLDKLDFLYSDALECIGENKQFDDLHRTLPKKGYLKSQEEMIELFSDLKEAIENTSKLADSIDVDLNLGNPTPPKFKFTKEYAKNEGLEFDSDEEYFAYKCREGLQKRLVHLPKDYHQEYIDRLEHEIKIINQMKFPGYMLIVWDFVREANSRTPHIPVGPGRGCLTKEALIWTKRGIKHLDKIKKDDFVLTHKNRFKKVLNTFKYDIDEELLTIETFYGDFVNPITLTKDHKIFVDNTWKEAKDITTKDYLTLPIPKREIKIIKSWDLSEFCDDYILKDDKYILYTYSQNKKNPYSIKDLSIKLNKTKETIKKYYDYLNKKPVNIKKTTINDIENYILQYFKTPYEWKNYITSLNQRKIKRYLKNTKYFRKFLGRWIGDGHIRKDKSRHEVSIVFYKDDKIGIDETLEFIKENNYDYSILPQRNVIYIHIHDKFLHLFFSEIFKDYNFESNSKYIPKFVFEMPKEEILEVLDGYISADGYVTNDRIKMASVSKRLTYDLKTLFFYIGIPASIRIDKRELKSIQLKKGNQSYVINIPSNGSIYNIPKERKNIYKIEDEYIKLKVRKITTKKASKVYDIEVEDDNSYTTTNYIVHNSAAGSLVAYSLGITNIDPLKYGLLFERFLNPERVSMPDIDMDFCQDRRGEIIEYVREKYGKVNVAQVITFGSLLAKGVLRDVARIFGIDYSIADSFVKLIPDKLGIKLKEAYEEEDKIKQLVENEPIYKRLYEFGLKLEGLKRNTGMHAAGVVISDNPLWEKTPLYRQDENYVTQYSLNFLEDVDLIKFDFLGLKTLTVIDNALKLVKQNHNVDIDFSTMEMNDKKVFELISSGHTLGLFQIESEGMQDLNKRLKPDCFEDIIAVLALYRPGPMDAGMTEDFVKRKNGIEPVSYFFDDFAPILEPILKPTYGVIVYQEQVMKIVQEIGGFSLGEADIIRRAMGKKNIEYMKQKAEEFAEGAVKKGLKKEEAIELFGLIEKFAGYGFNKSHSAAYAMITYQTAYLKQYYPAEFFSALLSSEKDNTDKIVKYINEVKRMGLEVLPPSIHKSGDDFTPVKGGILFGLGAIKGVGSKAIESIIQNRPFVDLEDFILKVDTSKVNKRVLEALIKSGAMDGLGFTRKAMLEQIEEMLEFKKRVEDGEKRKLNSLFSDFDDFVTDKLNIKNIPEFDNKELLKLEYEALGFYVSGHPLDSYKDKIEKIKLTYSSDIEELDKTQALFVGKVENIKIRTAKKSGNKFGIVTLMDYHGSFDFMVFKDMVEVFENLDKEEPIAVVCYIENSGDFKRINCKKVMSLDEAINENVEVKKKVKIENFYYHLELEDNYEKQFMEIYKLAKKHSGDKRLVLIIKTPFGFSLEIKTSILTNGF